jgi:hypothetical protein
VEDRIATVNEIFRLQDADEYSAAEKIYLTGGQAPGSAVVLAAGRGKGLEALTEDKPKVMLPVAGKPLLRWLVDGFKNQGINDITVVGGYKAEAIDAAGIKLVRNERHAETGELASLACAAERSDRHRDLLRRPAVPQLHPARPAGDRCAVQRGGRFVGIGAVEPERARFRVVLGRRRPRPVRPEGAAAQDLRHDGRPATRRTAAGSAC